MKMMLTKTEGRDEMQAEWILLLHVLDMDTSSQFTDVLSEVESKLTVWRHDKPASEHQPQLRAVVKKINQVLSEDYQCRRQMMIKRFPVTLESFAWGEKQKVVLGTTVSHQRCPGC
ncbi:protein FAM98B-like [Sebastes umbrosus]|uniref:protein FAM98B-like n=1 Tax=Sebastes umbrosus TaxID=72105 RepID=UPI00189E3212|nr:protein FAM98B-like [Sebastes umbrosus]XP_037646428.1 protein FAM98B-like [Sebastes umbrosus]